MNNNFEEEQAMSTSILMDFVKINRILNSEDMSAIEQLLQEWSQDHPRQPLGSMLNYDNIPILLHYVNKNTSQVLDCLLADCLTQNFPVETIQYDGTNVAHWIAYHSVALTHQLALQQLLSQGFQVARKDPTENPPCSAAMIALERGHPEKFKLFIAAYTEAEWENEWQCWRSFIDDLNGVFRQEYHNILECEHLKRLGLNNIQGVSPPPRIRL